MIELSQHLGVAQVKIGGRGVHAEVLAQRFSGPARVLEIGDQLVFGNDFSDAFFEVGELFGDGLEFVFGHFDLSLWARIVVLGALSYAEILQSSLSDAFRMTLERGGLRSCIFLQVRFERRRNKCDVLLSGFFLRALSRCPRRERERWPAK